MLNKMPIQNSMDFFEHKARIKINNEGFLNEKN